MSDCQRLWELEARPGGGGRGLGLVGADPVRWFMDGLNVYTHVRRRVNARVVMLKYPKHRRQ